MENCILYKYINRNFLKQVIVTSVLLSSSILFLIFSITDVKYSNENLGYIIFSLSILSFALLILISSLKGRRDNISKLSALIGTKDFDEVVIESTKEELNVIGNKVKEKIPYLLFVKAKGKVVFQMMFSPKDFNGVSEFLRELKNGQVSIPTAVRNVNYDGTNIPGTFVSEVA
jgi:hypothetical protein